MKFLLIGYNEIDGLGQHVASLNTNLNNMGHKSKAIFLHKSKKENNNTIKIKRSLFHRIIFFILEFLKKDFSNLFSFGNTTIKYKSIKNFFRF